MYQQQSGVGGGMLKRHFTMIYSQLDELKEQMSRVESNIADLALRMQELNRKQAQIEGSRIQMSQAEKTSQELSSAVEDLKRDIGSLRARFESELLSIGDPINSRGSLGAAAKTPPPPLFQPKVEAPKPQPEPQPEPEPPAPAETPQTEVQEVQQDSPPAPPAPPSEEAETPKENAPGGSSSDKQYEPSLKSLEEQLGLVPPSEEAANGQAEEKQTKPEEKKKRRFF